MEVSIFCKKFTWNQFKRRIIDTRNETLSTFQNKNWNRVEIQWKLKYNQCIKPSVHTSPAGLFLYGQCMRLSTTKSCIKGLRLSNHFCWCSTWMDFSKQFLSFVICHLNSFFSFALTREIRSFFTNNVRLQVPRKHKTQFFFSHFIFTAQVAHCQVDRTIS